MSVDGELRNVFPCELENRYVQPEDFLESLLKREPCAVGGVERGKRVRRHDRLADHLAANADLLESGLVFRGKEIPVSSTSGEGGSIDLLFLDAAGRFLIVEVKVKPEELDKACRATEAAREALSRDVSYRGRAAPAGGGVPLHSAI